MATVREATDTGLVIEIPRTFHQYTYISTLGCASSSIVLLVSDSRGNTFAAKVVSRDGLVSEGRLEYFEREIRLLEFVRHPNIVRLVEVVYLANNIVLIMEYCEQGDLFDYLLQKGPLRPSIIRAFVYQILKALECLHEKGYAHRDLKPENIFIDKDSRIKIGDLGLAKSSGSEGMLSTMCGTLYYTAPEVLEGESYDGRKSDIWSIGIIIYVMALRVLPWSGQDSAVVSNEIINGKIRFPPDFPMEMANIVQMCTTRSPMQRPTAAQLLDLPWLSEEQISYNREFGIGGRASYGPSVTGSISRPSIARGSAKLILTKAPIRACNSERIRPGGMSMSLARLPPS
jgi:serine/threonine protein kinase